MKKHLWEVYNPQKISVDIKITLKNKINKMIKKEIYVVSRRLKISPARLYDYFIYQKTPIPLTTLINLCNLKNISLKEIEKNIILYKQKTVPMKNSVCSPKLPIEIDPYFTAIVSHLFFDGSLPKDGKGTYYNQKNDVVMQDFIKKIKFIFGGVKYSLGRDHRGVLKCRIPRIIGEICKSIYDVDSFGTFDARIPNKIFDLNKDHKIAFILTAVLDEGSIAYDGSIQFGVSNRLMMEDFKRLCNEIGLDTKPIRQTKKGGHYYTYILPIKKFQGMLEKFKKKYPLISLRNKEERLKKALEIKNQEFFYTKNFADKRKNIIINELKKERTINYLASKYLIPPRTVRRYMYQFIKEGKIQRRKIGTEYLYKIT